MAHNIHAIKNFFRSFFFNFKKALQQHECITVTGNYFDKHQKTALIHNFPSSIHYNRTYPSILHLSHAIFIRDITLNEKYIDSDMDSCLN